MGFAIQRTTPPLRLAKSRLTAVARLHSACGRLSLALLDSSPSGEPRREKKMSERYEIRRGGVTVCRSGLERCGYSEKLLRQIIAAGYGYYVDGKRAKKGAQSA